MRPLVWGLLLPVVVLAAALALLHSDFARRRGVELLRAELASATGREVRIAKLDYDLLPLAAEVQGLVIAGPRPGDPAVLRASLVRVELSWQDLRNNVLSLHQIDLVRPEVRLQFNSDGSSNLPSFRHGQGGGKPGFAVRIGRINVQDGLFELNQNRVRLSLSAQALWGSAKGAGKDRLDLQATAQDVAITLPDARRYPLTLSASGRLDTAEGRLELGRALLAGPDLAARVAGTIGWGGQTRLDLDVGAHGNLAWVNRVGYMAQPIAGPAEISGRFALNGSQWSYAGSLASSRVEVLHRAFEGLAATFRGSPERLVFDVARGRFEQAVLSGKVVVETGARQGRGGRAARSERAGQVGGGRPVSLDLRVAGLSLQSFFADQFPEEFAGREGPVVELCGRATGRVSYLFQSSAPRQGIGRAELRLDPAGPPCRGLPLGGELPLVMDRGVLRVPRAQLAAPQQEITLTGFAVDLTSGGGGLDYLLATREPRALAPLFPPPLAVPAIPAVAASGPARPGPVWLPDSGHGTAAGHVTFGPGAAPGAPSGYRATVALNLLAASGPLLDAADRVNGSLTVLPQAVEDLRLEATLRGGALMLTGTIPIRRESTSRRAASPTPPTLPSEPLQLAIDAADWPLTALRSYLPAGFPAADASGTVSGRLDLGGDFDHLEGRAEAAVDQLVYRGYAVGKVRADVVFDPLQMAVDDGLIDSPAGKVLLRGRLDRKTGGIDLAVDAPSLSLASEPFRGALGGQLGGKLSLVAAFEGSLDRPQARLSLRAAGLTVGGQPLAPAGQGDESRVLVTWAGDRVQASGVLSDLIAFEGGGRLDRAGADLALDLNSSRLGDLLGAAAPARLAGLTGSFAGRLNAHADFAAGAYRADLSLADLRADFGGKSLANREPILLTVTPGRLRVRSFYLGETGTDSELVVSGSVGFDPPAPRLDLRVQSTLSAAWADLVVPQLDVTGTVNVLASVRGTVASPVLSGEAELRAGRLILPGLPNALEELEGEALLSSDKITFDNVHGRMGGGTLRSSGQVTLPGGGRSLSYRIDLAAQGISLRYPEGFISRGNASISLTSTAAGRQVRGVVDLDRLLYAEDVEVDPFQLLLRGLRRERLQVAVINDFMATTQLNLSIRGPGALRVTNNVADLRGGVDLTVLGSVGRPVLFGSVQLEPGGDLVYADDKYQVERGTVTFSNPNRIDPLIDLALKTDVQGYEITLTLSGTLERLNAKFGSNGGLADLEILALLAGGQRPQSEVPPPVATDPAAASQAVAAGFLAGQASAAISSRVGKLFGLDRFRIDPLAAETGQTTSGVAFTVGKRLNKDLYVTLSYDPSSANQNILQIQWQVARNMKLLLTQNGGKGYAVDAQWEKRF